MNMMNYVVLMKMIAKITNNEIIFRCNRRFIFIKSIIISVFLANHFEIRITLFDKENEFNKRYSSNKYKFNFSNVENGKGLIGYSDLSFRYANSVIQKTHQIIKFLLIISLYIINGNFNFDYPAESKQRNY